MKNFFSHIISVFLLGGLMIALSSPASAQTPAGTAIHNTASVRYSYLNGSTDTTQSNIVTSVVEAWGRLFLDKTVSRTNANVGDTVQFKISIGYSGNLGATNVVMVDTVPSHFKVLNSSKGTVNGNIVSWNVGTVTQTTPDSVTITAVIKLLANGEYLSKNTAYAVDSTGVYPSTSATVIIIGNRTADVELQKSVLVDTLRFGQLLPYKISARNTGNTGLVSVSLIDTIPDVLDFVDATDQRVRVQNGILTLEIPSMLIGDSVDFIFNTRVTGTIKKDRRILNTVYLVAEVPTDSLNAKGRNTPNNTILIGRAAAAAAVFIFNPQTELVKTATKDSLAVGDTMNYRIVYKNTGDTRLPDATIIDTVDVQKFDILLVSSNASLQNNIVSATVDTLAVGDSLVVSIRVRAKENAPEGYRNSASASSEITPMIQSLVVTPWKQTIGPNTPLLLLSKSVSRDSVVNGDSIKYTILIKNNGNVSLTNVAVVDTLPTQLTKHTVLYNKGTVENGVLNYFAGTLSVGEADSVVIVSVLNGNTTVPETVTNHAYARSNETTWQKSSVSFVSLIGRLDKLLLSMSVSSPTVFTGDSLNYVLRITNVSNRRLTNVEVRNPVPFQLENIRAEYPNTVNGETHSLLIESASTAGDSLSVNGSVVIFTKDTIDVGEVDSFYVKTNVRLDRPNFELILNTGYATSDQTEQIIAQAVTLVEPRTNRNFQLQLSKRVSKDTVHIGDTMSYVIHLKNITGGPLTKITVVDTLPQQLSNPRVIGNGKVNGRVITYELGYLGASQVDSIIIIAQLNPYGIHDGELVLNYAFARAFQIEEQTAYALFVAKTDPACRIDVIATPEKIIGNGRSKAYIEVRLTNTLGYPKPDGTPVVLTTTVGEFTNGQSMRVLYSKDGIVSDSLRATVAGNNLVNAMAIASADDGQGCKAKDTVQVVFFPGAIEGTVIDHRTQLPVSGAIVRAYSKTTDSLVGEMVTKADGYYLFAVAKTDSFRVTITTVNEFGKEITVGTEVTVTVSGGGDPPTPNQNSVSGAVYYLVSHEPVAAQNISILLQEVNTPLLSKRGRDDAPSGLTTIDSVFTDAEGTFKFDRIPAGQFRISLNHPSLNGSVDLTNSGNGQYVINANIAVVLNPNIEFEKTGPSRVGLSDSAVYSITVRNTGNLSTTNTVVIDSLHWAMKFIAATNGGIYQPSSHRIVWNIGQLDSLDSRTFGVTVNFVDSITNSTPSLNRASVTSNQTTPIHVSVPTLIYLPPTMRVWKTSSVHAAQPGDTVLYSIRMNNASGSFADSVSVTDNLPKQVEYLGSSVLYYRAVPAGVETDTVSYNRAAHSVQWNLDTLFVGDSATINLMTRVRHNLESGHHEYTNIAATSWSGGSTTTDLDSLSDATVRSYVSYLRVTKQALRKVVEIGDLATYLVTVSNTSASNTAFDVQVLDKIPFGFRYMAGSTFRDTMKLADPSGRRDLLWLLADSLAPGKSISFVYRLVVGAGAAEGNGINTAQAFGVTTFGTPMSSAEVKEQVEIRRGVFTTHGLIVGKVFYDDNRNRYQDRGETGVKGIELMMEDGTRIITGDDGKYSVPDVLPGEHVIRVRTHTLPKDSYLLMGYNDFAGDSTSRFVDLTESGIARVDFYLARTESRPDSLILSQSIAKIGDFSIQRIASPRNIVFIEDKRLASMKLTGLNFEVGKAVLKPESFVTLKQLADVLREYPDQPLIIAGHTDSMKIATVEFPNNKILSMARAMAVKNYLVEKQGINVDRIRIEGHGETRPVSTNKTIDGRSLNRRVEFYFTPSTEEKELTEMPVAIEIPIEYTGTEMITKVDFRDNLDPSLKYVAGSATFGDSTVHPQVNGNELHWTLTNLGSNFKYKLRYTVMLQRPDRYEATELKSTSSSICYFVGDSVLKCIDTLTTTNETAVAVRGRAVNFIMSGVLFDVGKATLRSAAISSLETTAKFLKEDLSATAVIEGHTDSSPIRTKEFPSNVELSQARANTIKQALITRFGIDESRLSTIGFGEFRPLASNMTKEGKQVNRRIEMRILRREFAANVLPEGRIDSSKLVVETLLPKNAPQGIDSLMRDKSKERYILKLDIQRKEKRNTVTMTVHDTIPAGLNLITNTVTSVRGVDSVEVSGNVLTIFCSATDSSIQLYYIAEVSDEAKDETTLIDDYTVRKVQSDGTVVEERTERSMIEIRKKRMLVRYQR